MQVCTNGKNMNVVKQPIPDMVSPNCSGWFQYIEDNKRPGIHFLYHRRTHSCITRVNNKIGLSRNSETASGIEIDVIELQASNNV